MIMSIACIFDHMLKGLRVSKLNSRHLFHISCFQGLTHRQSTFTNNTCPGSLSPGMAHSVMKCNKINHDCQVAQYDSNLKKGHVISDGVSWTLKFV
jgi:hypothetical protein